MYLTATAESLHAPESDPQMRTYLTWLEVEGAKAPALPAALAEAPTLYPAPLPPGVAGPAASPPPPAGAAPAATPKPPRPPGEADKHKHPSAKRRNKKKHRSKHSLAPLPPTGAAPAPPINVELVPLPPPPKPAPMVGPPFSRRDFVTFGIGVGAGALVTFLGCLIAVLGRG